MNACVTRIGLGFLALLWFTDAEAQPRTLQDLRAAHQETTAALERQQILIAATSKELDSLSREIRTLQDQTKARSLLATYRLQSLLQEAQRVSKELEEMNKARHGMAQKLHEVEHTLIAGLEQRVETLRKVANSRARSVQERRRAAKEIEELSVERIHLAFGQEDQPLPKNASTLLGNGDTPEEKVERLAAVRDMAQRMQSERQAIVRELKEIRHTLFLRAEVGHLLEEEAFFGERSFIRGGPSRQERIDPAALAQITGTGISRKSETDDAHPGETIPGGTSPQEGNATGAASEPATEDASGSPAAAAEDGQTPGTPTESHALPGGAEPAAPPSNLESGMGASAPLESALSSTPPLESPNSESSAPALPAENASENGDRDPLARLASEFGVPLEELEGETAAEAGLSLHERIQWLERRLSAAERILSLLRGKATQLEQTESR